MKLPILHLQDGLHYFEGILKAGELNFEGNEHYPDEIEVRVKLNKFEKNITCDVELRTTSHYICDRCLQPYTRKFDDKFRVLFHLGRQDFETEEDAVIMLSPEEKEIDLTPYIIEELILAVPMKNVCDEACKGICPGCGTNLNEGTCVCGEKPMDPRWEKLRELRK